MQYEEMDQHWEQVRSRDEQGATAVEYGLMVALIAVAILVAVTAVGNNMSVMFDSIAGLL
jgi:pilus assembly protein Flp/PilA